MKKYSIYQKKPGQFPRVVGTIWKTRENALEELSEWFAIDASKDYGNELLREYDIKTRDASGRIWTQDEIDAMDEFNGGEYIFPEDFDSYERDSVKYYVDEVDDEDDEDDG